MRTADMYLAERWGATAHIKKRSQRRLEGRWGRSSR